MRWTDYLELAADWQKNPPVHLMLKVWIGIKG
jgi:hypothetical protein